MTKLQKQFQLACEQAGLNVDLDYEVHLDKVLIKALLRIQDIGGKNGMLIFNTIIDMKGLSSALVSNGFGYSVLEEPNDQEEYDFEVFKDILVDWGWSGKKCN